MPYDSDDSKPTDKAGVIAEAKECFKLCQTTDAHNHNAAKEDIKFARLGEQWPKEILDQRKAEMRPALTINKMPAFIRQVVNDARQNKPSIKVRPVDSGADKKTADVFTGLIRNIEQQSAADIAYDTAGESAVGGGFGYIKVDIEYAFDDTFDKDILIKAVPDPFKIWGDPNSSCADSSDWMEAFELLEMTNDAFEKDYPGKAKCSFDGADKPVPVGDDESITVAIYWKRREVIKTLLLLSDGQTIFADKLSEAISKEDPTTHQQVLDAKGVTVVDDREARTYEVTRYVISGEDVLETEKWAGKYIPIIPVYGDVINLEGKRYFHSLIRHAKDAQRQFNFQRSAETEMIALEPKVPWVGPVGSFDTDPNWATANQKSHPFLEYDPKGPAPPQRTQVNMAAGAAAMQAARSANDDMKAIIGIYDASLGQKSNETSGKAILARQREGDVSTYHFIDNLARGVRHTGRIVLDLIPKVYTGPRIVRVLGEDGDAQAVPVNQPHIMGQQGPEPAPEGTPPENYAGVFDLTAGKYDLAVETGPSYTTRRVEAAEQMTAMFQAMPDAAPLLGDIWAKMQDWPFADKIEERLRQAREAQQGPPPEEKKMQMQMQLEQQKLQMQGQHDQAKAQADIAVQQQKMQLEAQKAEQDIQIERMKAEAQIEIERMKAGVQMELQQQKTQADVGAQIHKASVDSELRKQEAATKSESVKNDASTTADAIGSTIAKHLSEVKLQVNMPKMKRTAFRDSKGNLTHSIDEPMQ